MADTTTVRVRVTQDDIDAGVRVSCNRCPVARALKRAVPGCAEAMTDGVRVDLCMLGDDPNVYNLSLPIEATDAIAEFDRGNGMSPFEFDLSLPPTEAAHG